MIHSDIAPWLVDECSNDVNDMLHDHHMEGGEIFAFKVRREANIIMRRGQRGSGAAGLGTKLAHR